MARSSCGRCFFVGAAYSSWLQVVFVQIQFIAASWQGDATTMRPSFTPFVVARAGIAGTLERSTFS